MTKQTDALVEEVRNTLIGIKLSTHEAKELITLITASNLERVDKAVESTLSAIEGKGHPTSTVFHSAVRRVKKAIKQEFTESDDECQS